MSKLSSVSGPKEASFHQILVVRQKLASLRNLGNQVSSLKGAVSLISSSRDKWLSVMPTIIPVTIQKHMLTCRIPQHHKHLDHISEFIMASWLFLAILASSSTLNFSSSQFSFLKLLSHSNPVISPILSPLTSLMPWSLCIYIFLFLFFSVSHVQIQLLAMFCLFLSALNSFRCLCLFCHHNYNKSCPLTIPWSGQFVSLYMVEVIRECVIRHSRCLTQFLT